MPDHPSPPPEPPPPAEPDQRPTLAELCRRHADLDARIDDHLKSLDPS